MSVLNDSMKLLPNKCICDMNGSLNYGRQTFVTELDTSSFC